MAGQEHKRPTRRDDSEPDDAPGPAAPAAQTRDDDIDALLDEIDDTLETNSEEFVRTFVQKGGQ
ncbi:ubiquitin-like protein Pup [Quadrisphaera sp. GCM10027208]|uniref:ubiquitin-like protein Pup n=1 Tax=Quadrisphaera sp. GCM10027208 TaxID=3273423 RepID=UPI00360D8429|nr:ubiquitin-like protein Pup [Kineosporiaceae bacterium SCSIO 59966]